MAASSPEEWGWFTPPDTTNLLAAVARLPNPSSVVLVGGQSLAFWVDQFGFAPPPHDGPYLTQDADFLGTRADAQQLAEVLGAEIHIATIDDFTPNTAILNYKGVEGKRLLVDFLGTLIGLEEDEVRKLAVPFERGGIVLHVLHPLLCMESRFHNLFKLSGKRNRNGIAQASVSLEVTRAYVDTLLDQGDIRLAYIAARRIGYFATRPAATFCYQNYQLDPLQVVNPSQFPNRMFAERAWPAWSAKAERKRAIARRRATESRVVGQTT